MTTILGKDLRAGDWIRLNIVDNKVLPILKIRNAPLGRILILPGGSVITVKDRVAYDARRCTDK